MAEFLSEINIGKKVIEPILSVFKKKKNKSKMLEEQIRDILPCDVEELEEKEYALQSRREKRVLQRKQKRQMETQGKDHKFNTLTKNGKKTRNGAG